MENGVIGSNILSFRPTHIYAHTHTSSLSLSLPPVLPPSLLHTHAHTHKRKAYNHEPFYPSISIHLSIYQSIYIFVYQYFCFLSNSKSRKIVINENSKKITHELSVFTVFFSVFVFHITFSSNCLTAVRTLART